MGGHVARTIDTRYDYNILVRNTEGKKPLGRDRCRWENIEMDLK
jgi:hypothetical protein